jgi:hypothetical protein
MLYCHPCTRALCGAPMPHEPPQSRQSRQRHPQWQAMAAFYGAQQYENSFAQLT